MKIYVWLNSGANAFSKREATIDLNDYGVTDEEWAGMTEDEKEATAKEIAFECADWGFSEVS
jgi:hypothetical protein